MLLVYVGRTVLKGAGRRKEAIRSGVKKKRDHSI
jgi:hypothetical protein